MTNEEFIKSISKEGEVWKDIPGYEGYYMASTFGRILALSRTVYRKNGAKQDIKAHLVVLFPGGKGGYHYYTFCKDGAKKTRLIHRVIAETFLDNPDNKPMVDHIDSDKLNNRVDNLRWVTASENRTTDTALKHFENRYCTNGRPVVCLKNNKLVKIYQYQSQAKQDGFYPEKVKFVCEHVYTQHHGYQFMYYDEYNELLEKDQSLN